MFKSKKLSILLTFLMVFTLIAPAFQVSATQTYNPVYTATISPNQVIEATNNTFEVTVINTNSNNGNNYRIYKIEISRPDTTWTNLSFVSYLPASLNWTCNNNTTKITCTRNGLDSLGQNDFLKIKYSATAPSVSVDTSYNFIVKAYTLNDSGSDTKNLSTLVLNGDSVSPTLHLPTDITVEATGSTGAVVNYTATATDANPVNPAVTCNPASGSTFPLGQTTVNCFAVDAAHNTSTGSFYVTVEDTIVPVVDAGSDVRTNAEFTTSATASDSGSGIASYLWQDMTTSRTISQIIFGSETSENTTINVISDGVYTIGLTVTDNAGLSANDTFSLIWDKTAPEITIKGDNPYSVYVGNTYTDEGATALDYIDGDVKVEIDNTVDTETVGTYKVTYTATDKAGNSSEAIRIVNVSDIEQPIIKLIGDNPQTIEVFGEYKEQGAFVTDNYDSDLEANIDSTSVDTTKVGTYKVTYNATDSSGNRAIEVVREVDVVDTTAPTIELTGGNLTIEAGSPYIDEGAMASDNYDSSVSVVTTGDDFDTKVVGNHTITYTATDSSHNTAIATRTVTVEDTIAPVVDAGSDKNIGIEFLQDATVTENGSGISSYLWEKISGPGEITFGSANAEDTTISASADGTYVIRLTAIDRANLVSTKRISLGNVGYDEFTLVWDTSIQTPLCTENDFIVSEWGACTSNNTQTRFVTKKPEANCIGDFVPTTSKECTYVPSTTPSDNSGEFSGGFPFWVLRPQGVLGEKIENTGTTTGQVLGEKIKKYDFVFKKILKRGSRIKPDVSNLQTILNDFQLFAYPKITGYFGPITQAGLKSLQKANGLKVTGIVDQATMDFLNSL